MITTQQWQILLIWFLATAVSTGGYQVRLWLHPLFPQLLMNRMIIILMIGIESSMIALCSTTISHVDLFSAFTRSMIFVGLVVIITQLDLLIVQMALHQKKTPSSPV